MSIYIFMNFKFCMNRITLYMLFNNLHFPPTISTPFYKKSTLLLMTLFYLISPTDDGRLSCFQFFSLMEDASVNIFVLSSFCSFNIKITS